MSPKSSGALKKLRKFQRDPSLFFYDFFRKRVRDGIAAAPIGTAVHIDFSTADVEVIDGAVVIADPNVVKALRAIKAGKSNRVTLSWWK